MFSWFINYRRKKLANAPFPKEWVDILNQQVSHYYMLENEERVHLQDLIKVFVAEKNWEGCGGLKLTDEIRVTISAYACLLLLNLPHNYYENVQSILVYPSTVVPPQREHGFFENVICPLEIPHPIIGQSFLHRPVIIIWDAVLKSGRHPEPGANVVYHEFAHKLDMLDGKADGTPPLRDRNEYVDWINTCSREYLRLKHDAQENRKSFLDHYGAVNEAEFFTVATEQFFDKPLQIMRQAQELYRVLKEYYRQDPAKRLG